MSIDSGKLVWNTFTAQCDRFESAFQTPQVLGSCCSISNMSSCGTCLPICTLPGPITLTPVESSQAVGSVVAQLEPLVCKGLSTSG